MIRIFTKFRSIKAWTRGSVYAFGLLFLFSPGYGTPMVVDPYFINGGIESPPDQVGEFGGVVWGEPVNLSNSSAYTSYPSVCADPSGVVHVAYCSRELNISGCAAVNYTNLKGGYWETPIDILVPRDNSRVINEPRLACSGDGYLHLAWVGDYTSQVYYSTVYAPLATSAKNWSPPQPVGGQSSNVSSPFLAADYENNIHIVYAIKIGGDSGIYYSRSINSGEDWQQQSAVFENYRDDLMVDHPRLSVNENGDIFVVWAEFNFPSTFPPAGIKFARSADLGFTWDRLSNLSGPFEYPGVLALGNQIHMIWSGTDTERHKFHRFSTDAGATWSSVAITLDEGGFQFWSGMAADSLGRVHIVQPAGAQVGYLMYQMWNNGIISPPMRILDHPVGYPDNPANTQGTVTDADLSIGLGNQLHTVTTYAVRTSAGDWTWNTFYIPGSVDSPPIAPIELTVTDQDMTGNEVEAEETSVEIPEITATPGGVSDFSSESAGTSDDSSFIPIMAGILPSIIILAVFLMYRSRTKK